MVQPVIPSDANCVLILFMVASLQPAILIVSRYRQSKNMASMSVTFLVSQPLKSKEVRPEQCINMAPMSVTFLVSKLDQSKEVIEPHSENMYFVLVMPSNTATGILQFPLAPGVTL